MIKSTTLKYNKGAALLLFVLFFMFASFAVSFLVSRGILSDLYEYDLLSNSKQAYYSAEALSEDVAYRNIVALDVDEVEENILFSSDVYATTTINTVDGLWTIDSLGVTEETHRVAQVVLAEGTGASFNFGLQTGNGGILMTNSSKVVGNVFSNGSIVGDKTGGGALVEGDVISAGPSGYVEEVHATGSLWANTIHDVEVDGDAYYNTEASASVVYGTRHTPYPNQATATMPIPDSVVDVWKTNIETGGTVIASTDPECITGTYIINSDMTLGDTKIECNLEVSKNSTTLTLTGPIWVEGNISFDQGPTIRASSSVGSRSVQIIADDPESHATGSQISVNQSTDFYGSGSPKSYVLLISMNTDAEDGGSNYAIDLSQSANGDILVYAAHGLISMGNNISLKEVTAYQIDLGNGAEVIYESGLVNQLFTSGPGGGFTISDWGEI